MAKPKEEFPHNEILIENNIDPNTLPKELRERLRGWDLAYSAYIRFGEKPETYKKLVHLSTDIHDEIVNWDERDREEEPVVESPIENQTQNNNTMSEKEKQDQDALKARAVAAGLPPESSLQETEKKEKENAEAAALKERALKVNLPENATLKEVEEAEAKAKETSNGTGADKQKENTGGFSRENEIKIAQDELDRTGKVYVDRLRAAVGFKGHPDEVDFKGTKLKRRIAYYWK